ncbi:MAG TPA: FadR/GntR family transcriptional regulator [Woeseiaceae bacterium]|nr:FadR/GntR family transcriptional regulator [Woeseiaceae bacterium]
MPDKTLEIEPIVKREALPEQIVRQLAGLVRRGELQPGDRLPAERALAEQLGVGRPTLREALRALQLLGVLDIRHGGGVFVSELQPDTLLGPLHSFLSLERHDVGTVLEARRIIEGAVLAFVARVIDERSLAKLEKNLQDFHALVDSGEDEQIAGARINKLAEEFRVIVEDSVGNPILNRAVTSLDILSTATRYRITERGSLQQLLVNHRRIVAALAAHDPDVARRALEAHIDYLCEICDVKLRDGRHG